MKRYPIRRDRDKFDHFRADFRCPACMELLTSYTYGRVWTENGLSEEKRTDCPVCGQEINWSDVPRPEKEGGEADESI